MSLIALQHPAIEVKLAYATPENFTGKILYHSPQERVARLHELAAQALYRGADLAQGMGLRLQVLDAFRPVSVQYKLWEFRPDPEFVADPALGSDHSRGTAVDLTLTNALGTVLDMGTGFDAALPQSHHGRCDLPKDALQNRAILLGLMTAAGFALNPFEWWHYSLPNSNLFPLVESD